MDVDGIMKLVTLVNEYSFHFCSRGEFYKHVFGLLMGAPFSLVDKPFHGFCWNVFYVGFQTFH